MLAMRAGGQTSVCGLSFSRSGIGTVITGRIKTLSNVGYIRVCKTVSRDNEQRCNQSGIGCHRLHRNKYVALLEKLYRIQCTNGRMNDAVFKVGMEFQRQHHNKHVFFLEKLYRTYVSYDERMQYRVECDETYVCEVRDVE
jgi:hypothetical protein